MWLVGLMGSGKTSVGREASSLLGVPFVDTDEMVANRLGCSIPQFWGEHGEEAFRDIEGAVVNSLAESEGMVSTGGGVVEDARNRRIMAESGDVVWLQASPATLARRVAESGSRPLLAADKSSLEVLEELAAKRSDMYREIASISVDTDKLSLLEVTLELVKLWNR